MQNARTWSQESKNEDDTIRQRGPLEPKNPSFVNIPKKNTHAGRTVPDIDGDLVADGFFFHDTPQKTTHQSFSPRYSPPSKRTTFDKWAVLGERRRAHTLSSEAEKSPDLWKPDSWKARREIGLGFTGFGAKVWDNKANTVIKDKGRECPWVIRDQAPKQRSKAKLPVCHGDLEWVGGTFDLHL